MAATDDDTSNVNQTADADEVALLNAPGAGADSQGQDPKNSPADAGDDHDDADGDDAGDSTAKADSELEGAADEAEREAIRVRRREERKNRRERAREKVEDLERNNRALAEQVQRLSQQVGTIQDANTSTQMAHLDQAIDTLNRNVTHYKQVIADATAKQDGVTVAEATEAMVIARERAQQLTAFKNRTNQQKPAQTLNPVMVNLVQQFVSKHKWYGGPQSNDSDTRVMRTIDDAVAAEGFDPTTPAYYEELEARGKKYLPHRFGTATPASQSRTPRQPVAGAGGDGGKAGGGSNFALSAERVKAMKDSGAWDDPKRRDKMIRDYQDYDKKNGAGR